MPLNETKPAFTLYLPSLSARSSLFIQKRLLYEWHSHALAVTTASPPICSKPVWPPVLPMSWTLSPSTLKPKSEAHGSCQLPLSSLGLSSYQWPAPSSSLLPLTALPESGLHYYCPPQHSGWLCASSLVSSDMSTSQMWPCYFLLKSSQELPTLAGSCSKCPTGDRHCVIQLLLITTWAVHWLDSGHIEPPVFSRWAHLSLHDTGREMSSRRNKNPFTLKTQFKHLLLQFLPPESPSGTTPSLWPYPCVQASGSVRVNCHWSS